MTPPFNHVLARPVEEFGWCLQHCPDFGLGSTATMHGLVDKTDARAEVAFVRIPSIPGDLVRG